LAGITDILINTCNDTSGLAENITKAEGNGFYRVLSSGTMH